MVTLFWIESVTIRHLLINHYAPSTPDWKPAVESNMGYSESIVQGIEHIPIFSFFSFI